MPTPKSAWRIAGDEVLADGEWHHDEEVIAAMALYVPCGKAARAREKSAVRQRSEETPIRPIDPVRIVEIGSREVAVGTARSAVVAGTWERDGDRLRLRGGRIMRPAS